MRIEDSFVTVEGLQIYAYHGVLPIEQKVGNTFEVSVTLHYDALLAMNTDNINDALNYASVVADIVRVMAQPKQLLEHVAMNIIDTLNNHFKIIKRGSITIKKLNPPIAEPMQHVSFSATWSN
jgi:dihydroneopterin aldolase